MKQQEYLDRLTQQLRYPKAKELVQEEVRAHIEDQKEAYIENGMYEEEAEEEAVRQMGDPEKAGIELDRIHKPQMAWDMLFLVMILGGVGLLIQYVLCIHFNQTSFMPSPVRSLVGYILGNIVMIGICMLDYSQIGKWAKVIYLLLIGMNIIYICSQKFFIGETDISSLLLLFVPLYGAILYDYRGEGYKTIGKGILWSLPAFLVSALSFKSSVVIILGISFTIVFAIAVYKEWFQVSRKRVWITLGIIVVAVPLLIIGLLTHFGPEYYQKRLQVWLHPFTMENDEMYGRILPELLAQNQWFGQNPLINTAEWTKRMPAGNDYSLTYLASDYGIVAAVILVGLIIILMVRGIRISLMQRNQLGMIMGTGCSIGLSVQFMFYVLCNIGILPSAAIFCPFITYGLGGMFTTYILLGILLSIYRYQNVIGELKKKKIRYILSKRISD